MRPTSQEVSRSFGTIARHDTGPCMNMFACFSRLRTVGVPPNSLTTDLTLDALQP